MNHKRTQIAFRKSVVDDLMRAVREDMPYDVNITRASAVEYVIKRYIAERKRATKKEETVRRENEI